MKKLISILIPCFNEEDVIDETFRQVKDFINNRSAYSFECIFIDDGSTDRTYSKLSDLVVTEKRIFKIIKLSRNFGHQLALTAGLDYASGDAVVIIDADLQDPFDIIDKMIEKWNLGFEVISGKRVKREGETKFKKVTASVFYKLLNFFSEIPIPLDTGDFRLIDKKVLFSLKEMPERNRFLRGMISWIGFKQTIVEYERKERFAGKTKYPFIKMFKFALDGIISFSSKPLIISFIIGIIFSIIALILSIYTLYLRIFTDQWITGWAALMISILFFGGVQLISIGVLSLYVGRILDQVKSRPMYIVENIIND
tara:strand:- start:1641 stop:2576 length:936 start_codon:yes stop_codon:yes gene_type:complete